MTKDQLEEESEDTPEVMDQDKLNEMIREAVREIVPEFLTGDTEDEEETEEPQTSSSPLKNADIQEEVRRQMAEAMKSLQSQRPKAAKKPVKQSQQKAEPEEAPTPPKKKVDLGKLLWGN